MPRPMPGPTFGMTLADLVMRNAAFSPEKVAISCEGTVLTYAGFSARIEAASRALAQRFGVAHGDRILASTPLISWCFSMPAPASARRWYR